jgi:hypothetical protein
MATIRLGSVSLDCADPSALATFWSTLLDGEIVYTSDEFVAIKLDHVWLSTVKVENYQTPQWPQGSPPKQMHLDLAVDDLATAEEQALRLGAVTADFQPGADRFRVMFDPSGHPFCLTTMIPD